MLVIAFDSMFRIGNNSICNYMYSHNFVYFLLKCARCNYMMSRFIPTDEIGLLFPILA